MGIHIRDMAACRHRRGPDNALVDELLHPSFSPYPLAMSASIAHARVLPGEATKRHRLTGASEVYIILSGDGLLHVGEESAPVRAGHVVYIPPGEIQWVENTGDAELVFLVIVSPPWDPAHDERV